MCGIAGIIATPPGDISRAALESMTATLNHRGPDDSGVHILRHDRVQVGLGHARLSILDLSSAGHQPMCNEDGSVWLTYNGEIYNFSELRNELEGRGHVFASSSDTEVIIHGYEEYGLDILQRLNGMFAFALWDDREQALILARDRYGQKPLYYAPTATGLIFASELKSLLRHPDVSRDIDPRSLSRYLFYEYVPAPRSMIRGVRKVPAGNYLRLKNGDCRTAPYWTIDFDAVDVPHDRRDIEAALMDRLKQSVQRRLVSDVPLGVFLSGGIDSSAIVALMSEMMPAEKIKTFSIGFEEKSFDESSYARQVARHFGTDHHEQTLTPSTMVDILPEIWDFLDEPFADASVIPTYLLSRFTRQHVTVALGGDGGDELFAGYDPFVAHRLARIYDHIPRPVHEHLIAPAVDRLPVSRRNMSLDFKLKQTMKGIPYPAPVRNQVWLGSFSPEEQRFLLNPEWLAALDDPCDDIRQALEGREFANHTDEIIYLYSRFYLTDDILTKVDRASMATSLEVRAPFLDVELAEFVNSLPANLKLHGLTRKYILKKSLESRLPREILYRKKKGFGIPLAHWLRTDLRPLLLETFTPERLHEAGIFNPAAVGCLVDDHLQGRRDNRKQLWTLLMFEMWRERYV